MTDQEQPPRLPCAVEAVRHRALGAMVRLRLGENLSLDLTPQEAGTLSLALAAVRAGRSPEREIFMSPIASDGMFVGRVTDSGMIVDTEAGGLPLDWCQVEQLAEMLRAPL